jgi:hypothetical protein
MMRNGLNQILTYVRNEHIKMDLHSVFVALNSKTKTAFNLFILSIFSRSFQYDGRYHCFLRLYESDFAEFLPVFDQPLFSEYVMYGSFSL